LRPQSVGRGTCLAEGLGHCGLCHTPKNVLGGDKAGAKLLGYALQDRFVPDIIGEPRRCVVVTILRRRDAGPLLDV
jgi:hypothetical protein